jgi:uncharacterized membrane protein (DUF485 family)
MPFKSHFRHEAPADNRKIEYLGILAKGKTNNQQGIRVEIGTVIGVSMIATGLMLLAVVIWKSVSYRNKQREIQRNQDD